MASFNHSSVVCVFLSFSLCVVVIFSFHSFIPVSPRLKANILEIQIYHVIYKIIGSVLGNLMRTHFLFNPIHRPHYISYNISFLLPSQISQRAGPVTSVRLDVRERLAVPFSTNLNVATREIHICSPSQISISPHLLAGTSWDMQNTSSRQHICCLFTYSLHNSRCTFFSSFFFNLYSFQIRQLTKGNFFRTKYETKFETKYATKMCTFVSIWIVDNTVSACVGK